MTDKEIEDKIRKNNEKISNLLKENENILKENNYNPPETNFILNDFDKIEIPSGYIRTNDTFIKKYHLYDIFYNSYIKKNVAYAFQLTDMYDFYLSRFYVWGSIKTLLLKSAIVNLCSIFEAVVLECSNNICSSPSLCSNTKSCNNHFSKKQRNNSYDALKRLNLLHIVSFSEDDLRKIEEIICLRNHVHIRLTTENEFLSQKFSYEAYNTMKLYLKQLINEVLENGVPLYNKCCKSKESGELNE